MECLFYGGELCWNSDFSRDEVFGEDEGNECGIVSYYTCMTCGRGYEIADPPKEEMDTTYADYWNNH